MTPITKGELAILCGGPIIRAGTAPRIYRDENPDAKTAVALARALKEPSLDLAEALRRQTDRQQDLERAAWNASVDAQRRAKGKA